MSDPKIVKLVTVCVAIAAFAATKLVTDPTSVQALIGIGLFLLGSVGVKRPGDVAPKSVR